jgi:hypothetical protein
MLNSYGFLVVSGRGGTAAMQPEASSGQSRARRSIPLTAAVPPTAEDWTAEKAMNDFNWIKVG